MPRIACNLASYRQYRDGAFAHLAHIGLTNVELPCPSADEADNLKTELAHHGLTATSLIVPCSMAEPDVVEQFTDALGIVAQMHVHTVFTSVKAGDLDRALVYDRLRQIGDAADDHEIIVAMETHPDLITNGDVGRETMAAIDHPNVRVNFDTANVYYYNRDITAVEELDKVIEYVAAVHLKDTNGAFETWHFPALGEGVVDFPVIFEMLDEEAFDGPFTMELEGIQGEELTREEVEKRVEQSLQYLKDHGLT